jgi:hypothetical protein
MSMKDKVNIEDLIVRAILDSQKRKEKKGIFNM